MRCFRPFLLIFAMVLAGRSPAQNPERAPEPWDVVIRGGHIVDGTGNPWFEGDVAIRGDKIVDIGKLDAQANARKLLDARGLVVAPGFIDIHSHSDYTLLQDGDALSKIRQGVTTEVLGEDSSAGPAQGKHSEARYTSGGTTRTWTTLGGYFDALEKQGIAPNVASHVGLGTLLQCVQGDSLGRPAAHQLQEMKQLLDEANRAGKGQADRHAPGPGLETSNRGQIKTMTRYMARIAAIRRVGQAERRPTGRGLVGLISFDPPYQYLRAQLPVGSLNKKTGQRIGSERLPLP